MDLMEALVQYCDIRQEIRDIRERIIKNQRQLEKLQEEGTVADVVRGTRQDGTIGPIKVVGYPIPAHSRIEAMIKRRVQKLHILEDELLEATSQVDDYIAQIPKSELRQIFRLYYLDDLTWDMVAMRMNYRYPSRKIPYTKDNYRIKHDRYMKKSEKN